jgi:hypothetical protein
LWEIWLIDKCSGKLTNLERVMQWSYEISNVLEDEPFLKYMKQCLT